MPTTRLRRSGDSMVVTVPPSVLDAAGLSAASVVNVEYDPQVKAIVLRPSRPRYSLEELLAACDVRAPATAEDAAWLADESKGDEAI